jgi:hypothetical protein
MEQPVSQLPDQNQISRMMQTAELQRRLKNGASNFYWIAGLSVINTLLFIFGGGITFVVGLGITQFVDGFAYGAARDMPAYAILFKGIGFIISVVISSVFVLFGLFASRGHKWAFITGMVLYALDAILMLVFKAYLGLGFHLFFLWLLYGGLRALNQIQKSIPQTVHDPTFPKNIGS